MLAVILGRFRVPPQLGHVRVVDASTATVATDGVNLDRILTERRKELLAEGYRFFDLIRNKRDIVRSMSVRVFDPNGTPLFIGWQDYRILFPIPIDEINANPDITQNPEWKNN